MDFLRRFTKAFSLSLIDLIRGNYTYHSGALTYHFMLSVAPITFLLVNILLLLPVAKVGEIENVIDKIFPQHTSRILYEILEVQKNSRGTSLIAIGMAYFFSVNFIKHISRALSFVTEGEMGDRKEIFYWLFMPAFLSAVVLGISFYFFLSVYLKVVFPKALYSLADASSLALVTLMLFLIYLGSLKRRANLFMVLFVSFIVAFIMFLFQFLFTWYIAHIFKGNLIYGSLSTVIALLLWINLIFLLLLFGGRLIHRLLRIRYPQ